MPLYQEQGEDGFFVVREIHPLWLRLSEVLRRWGGRRWVHWLPGITQDPDSEDLFIVNRRIARWSALRVLRLLGFRKVRDQGHRLVVIQRPGGR